MNLITRLQTLFVAKTEAVLDATEDPRETLEYAYNRQRDLHQKVKQGLVEVATARRQLEGQATKLRARLPELEGQAKRALAANREDLARVALQRKQTSQAELARLERQLAEATEEERKLTQAEQQFAQRLDAFRTRRETLAARYTSAQAQVNLNEAMSGISGEFAELGLSLGRAEEKIERLQSRAVAIDTLLAEGALTLVQGADDGLDAELREVTEKQAVEEELKLLKGSHQ